MMEKKDLKLAVIGTRSYTNKNRVYFEIDAIRQLYNVIEIISGVPEDSRKQIGADVFARDYAKDHSIKYVGYPADWDDMGEPCLKKKNAHGWYNALAGPNRNTKISQHADGVIAFWNGVSTGTSDCLRKFQSLKKMRKTVRYLDK